jgi:ribosomal protein L11 methyltransferase
LLPFRIDLRAPRAGTFDRLVDLGAIDIESSPDGGLAALLPDSLTPQRVAQALGVDAVSVSPAVGRDDESVWILHTRPIRIGRLSILPAHFEAAPDAIRLADTPAFGTGVHPTTALCLEVLEAIVQVTPPATVLDVGTGTGVLALAALALGVPRALGIDTEDEAIRAAADNARLNGFDRRLELRRGGPDSIEGAWPLVLANVLAAPLIEMAPLLVRRVAHRGELVLSGIPVGVEPDVVQVYSRLGMRRVDERSRAGWVALTLLASW